LFLGRAGGFTVAGPSKGPFRNRPKQRQEQKQKPRTAVFTAAAQAIRGRTYSRNSQSSTATPAEPGDLPFGLETMAVSSSAKFFEALLMPNVERLSSLCGSGFISMRLNLTQSVFSAHRKEFLLGSPGHFDADLPLLQNTPLQEGCRAVLNGVHGAFKNVSFRRACEASPIEPVVNTPSRESTLSVVFRSMCLSKSNFERRQLLDLT